MMAITGGGEFGSMEQENSRSMFAAPKSKAPAQKKSKATSNIGGKKRLNDDMSTKLYKMSKQ